MFRLQGPTAISRQVKHWLNVAFATIFCLPFECRPIPPPLALYVTTVRASLRQTGLPLSRVPSDCEECVEQVT